MRDRDRPERGRFTSEDATAIFHEGVTIAATLLRDALREETVGARIMVRNGAMSLAIYRAIRKMGVEPGYATELTTDYLWVEYRKTTSIQRWIGHLFAREPRRQMRLIQRIFLRFPMASPGYRCTVREVPGAFAYDIARCPVYDYFATQDAEALEFFRRSWCTLDYPLAEHLVEGGRFERSKVLSAGDDICDMRWCVGRSADANPP